MLEITKWLNQGCELELELELELDELDDLWSFELELELDKNSSSSEFKVMINILEVIISLCKISMTKLNAMVKIDDLRK